MRLNNILTVHSGMSPDHKMLFFGIAVALVLIIFFCAFYCNICCCNDWDLPRHTTIYRRISPRPILNNNSCHHSQSVYTNHIYSSPAATGWSQFLGQECPPPPSYSSVVTNPAASFQNQNYRATQNQFKY